MSMHALTQATCVYHLNIVMHMYVSYTNCPIQTAL